MPDEKHPDTAGAGTGNADYAAALSGLAVVESGLASVRERLTALAAVRPSRPAEPVMPGGIAEVIHGEAEQQHMVEQLQREARKEVLTFVRPPYVAAAGNMVQKERLTAGVEYRSLYETTALVYPGAADMPGFVEPGELARAAPSVPMKLMIVDAERALLPLSGGRDRSVVSSAGLLLLHPRCWWTRCWSSSRTAGCAARRCACPRSAASPRRTRSSPAPPNWTSSCSRC